MKTLFWGRKIWVWVVALGAVMLGGCSEGLPGISSGAFIPNDDPHVEAAQILGGGMRRALFLARFTQKQDLLFVVDDSGSMEGEINTVRSNLNQFFSTMNTRRMVDYRVAVTTTDEYNQNGDLVPSNSGLKVLSNSTENAVAQFEQILGNIDTDGSGVEMGYRASELAIERHGSQFMRDGVPLGIVILSDATDKSCRRNSEGKCQRTSVADQAAYFKNLRNHNGVRTKALLFPIAANYLYECESQLESGENWEKNGLRYSQVQSLVGTGFFGSICGDLLELSLWEVARRISNRGICYDLPGKPTGQKMSVAVDGEPVSADEETGYHFESGTGSICFAGTLVPHQGQEIDVTYEDASL